MLEDKIEIIKVFKGGSLSSTKLINHPEFKNWDFSKLRFGFGGGMAVQNSVADKWLKITGSPLVEGYGLTETSPVLTINPLDELSL